MLGSKWLTQTVVIMATGRAMEARETFWLIKIRRGSLTKWEVSDVLILQLLERNVPLGDGENDRTLISAMKEALKTGNDLSPYERTKLKAEYENKNLAKNIKLT